MLVFGTANQTFPSGWLQQSFQFQNPFFHDPKKNDMHGCPFGLIQKKGGPCGILAVVQAYIIKVVLNIIRKQKHIVYIWLACHNLLPNVYFWFSESLNSRIQYRYCSWNDNGSIEIWCNEGTKILFYHRLVRL